MIRPPISYPGAKWKCIDLILSYVPDGIEDWREPFFGGGSVTLGYIQSNRFSAKRILVGDLAKEMWAFWTGTKMYANEAAEICKNWWQEKCPAQLELSVTPDYSDNFASVSEEALKQGNAFWKWAADIDCTGLSIAERCARVFLVNKISFSGMGDSGSMSKDNFAKFNLGWTDKLVEISKFLQKVEIINAPFQETMANPDKDKTFIFLDPPYIAQEKSGLYGRKGDTHHGFPHLELADLCKGLECKWLMTLDDSIASRKLYRGCMITPFTIAYTMAGKCAEDALAGEEIFIHNYKLKDEGEFSDIKSLL